MTLGARAATTSMAARGRSRSGESLLSLLTVASLLGAAATFQRQVRKTRKTSRWAEVEAVSGPDRPKVSSSCSSPTSLLYVWKSRDQSGPPGRGQSDKLTRDNEECFSHSYRSLSLVFIIFGPKSCSAVPEVATENSHQLI